LTEERVLGKRYRALQFLAMTEDILVPTMLFPEPRAAELRGALVDYLEQHRHDWDLIELDEIADGSPLRAALAELSRRCGSIHREPRFHDCPYLDLSQETAESFFGKRSRKLLKNLRAAERKLGEEGAVKVTILSSDAEIAAGFDLFLEIAGRSWKQEPGVGMASDARYAAFYRHLLQVFARRHGARIMLLEVDGKPIAATCAIEFDGVYHSLQIVHDEAYSRFSPGTLLEFREFEDLFRSRSVRRYEFLGGALNNKRRWTSDAIATSCIRVHVAETRTRLLDLYEGYGKPVAKKVLRRIGVFKTPPQMPAV
jgi:hypothetical protein